MPRPGKCPDSYERKPTYEELKELYPLERVSLYDLYYSYHKELRRANKKKERYDKIKAEPVVSPPPPQPLPPVPPALPPPPPESPYPPIIKDTKTKKLKN
jgi:hypothetical protein